MDTGASSTADGAVAAPAQESVGVSVLRLGAFADRREGGSPAGVVIDAPAGTLTEATMQRTAAEVGYSETAFVVDGPVTAGRRRYRVRYFSPAAEVPFCGHATVALAGAVARRTGPGLLTLDTPAGAVPVRTALDSFGNHVATLRSVEPAQRPIGRDVLEQALGCFGWSAGDLDPMVAPGMAYAGAWHLVVVLRDRALLRSMQYDYAELRRLSLTHGWVTVHVAYRASAVLHHVRAPFPYGGVVEDPATGAGAAAYGAYLRALGVLPEGGRFRISQGVDMGRPCVLDVDVPPTGPVLVTGTAIPID
jgi:PhzF family phenazine biosynthesis protein